MLVASLPALPHERRPAVGQRSNLRSFLIPCADCVDSESGKGAGKAAIQSLGADPQTVPVCEVVLPGDITASSPNAKTGMGLVPWQRAGDAVLHTIGDVGIGLAHDCGGGDDQASA